MLKEAEIVWNVHMKWSLPSEIFISIQSMWPIRGFDTDIKQIFICLEVNVNLDGNQIRHWQLTCPPFS